jgi:hypothetical protein
MTVNSGAIFWPFLLFFYNQFKQSICLWACHRSFGWSNRKDTYDSSIHSAWLHPCSKPIACTHYNFLPPLPKYIFEQLLWSELMSNMPVDCNPKPLPLYWTFSLSCYFLCQNAMSYTLKQVFVWKLRRRFWYKLQDITVLNKEKLCI